MTGAVRRHLAGGCAEGIATDRIIGIANAAIGSGARKGRRCVIDVPAALLVVDHAAHRQPVGDDRNVDHGVESAARITVRSGRVAGVHHRFSHIDLRLVA